MGLPKSLAGSQRSVSRCEALWTGDEQGLPEISVTRLPENSGRINLEQLLENQVIGNLWLSEKCLTDYQFGNLFGQWGGGTNSAGAGTWLVQEVLERQAHIETMETMEKPFQSVCAPLCCKTCPVHPFLIWVVWELGQQIQENVQGTTKTVLRSRGCLCLILVHTIAAKIITKNLFIKMIFWGT